MALWQPRNMSNPRSLEVTLDKEFASRMYNAKITRDARTRMNEIAAQMLKKSNIKWPEPFRFYENTGFVSQCSIGENGKWLAVNTPADILFRNSCEIVYYSHNIDTTRDAYTLLTIVDIWAEYADELIEP